MSLEDLTYRLIDEHHELTQACVRGKGIIEEAADVANIAMMMADNARALRAAPANEEALSDEQLVTLEQRVFSLNAFDDDELRQVFADLRSAQAAALRPGQVPVGEDDLRWLVARESESGNGGCYGTCPARARCPVEEDYYAEVSSDRCEAALLAHIGLTVKTTAEKEVQS